jgi:hypothetical protein
MFTTMKIVEVDLGQSQHCCREASRLCIQYDLERSILRRRLEESGIYCSVTNVLEASIIHHTGMWLAHLKEALKAAPAIPV